jgi:hypothetical protein
MIHSMVASILIRIIVSYDFMIILQSIDTYRDGNLIWLYLTRILIHIVVSLVSRYKYDTRRSHTYAKNKDKTTWKAQN